MEMEDLIKGELIMYKNHGDKDYRIGKILGRGREGDRDLIMVSDQEQGETHEIPIENVKLSFPVGQPVYFINPTDRIPTTRIGTIASPIGPSTVGERTIYVYNVNERGGGEHIIPFEYVKLSRDDLTSLSETAADAARYQGFPLLVEAALPAVLGPPGVALAAAKPFSTYGATKLREKLDSSINSQITNILEKIHSSDERFKRIEGRCEALEKVVIHIMDGKKGMDTTGVAEGGGRKKKRKSKKSKSKKKKTRRRKTKRRS
jgi:hypothetical protein